MTLAPRDSAHRRQAIGLKFLRRAINLPMCMLLMTILLFLKWAVHFDSRLNLFGLTQADYLIFKTRASGYPWRC